MPLWLLLLFAVLVIAGAGWGVKTYADRQYGPEEVTWREYAISLALIALVVVPLVGYAGVKLARRDLLTYHEFMNGSEVRAYTERTDCSRDGPCRWDYDCDPYIVPVEYECGDTDHPRTCTRYETRYHSCPYVNYEDSYYVDTTLGTYAIDTHRFPDNPRTHRWEPWRGEPLSDYVIERAGTGEPDFWTAARDRIKSGDPGPVTKSHAYTNYVLASNHTILKRYHKDADAYRAMNLLPPITASIRQDSFYRSDKVHLVGCSRSRYNDWDDAVEKLNAAFGQELQGDVRLVLVCDQRAVRDPDGYQFALQAYWQNTAVWKRTALPKNTVVIILGTTDGATVAWGRSFTGMPVGNNVLNATVRDSFSPDRRIPWSPETAVGTVTGSISSDGKQSRITYARSGGVLTDVLWGVSMPASRFVRTSMSGKHHGRGGLGFTYLSKEIELTGLQKFMILLVAFLTSAGVFALVSINDFFNAKGYQ